MSTDEEHDNGLRLTLCKSCTHIIIFSAMLHNYTGCMLMIDNGAATVTHYINDGATLVIEYTCNRGYHFSLNNNKLNRVCINGNMPSKPPPCKR